MKHTYTLVFEEYHAFFYSKRYNSYSKKQGSDMLPDFAKNSKKEILKYCNILLGFYNQLRENCNGVNFKFAITIDVHHIGKLYFNFEGDNASVGHCFELDDEYLNHFVLWKIMIEDATMEAK